MKRRNTFSQPKLPHELMYLIFDCLSNDPPALFKLLTLHTSYLPRIERLLYHKRKIFSASASHLSFLATVTRNPRLASYVVRYDLRPTISYGGWKNDDIDSVAPAIANMVNLKEFHVDMWMYNPFDTEELFQALKNKKLESFEWSTWCRKQEIMELLPTQPNLRRLKTQLMGDPRKRLHPSCCRKLWYLEGDRGLMNALMPDRDVAVLVWTPLMYEGHEPVSPQLAPALNRLRAMVFDGKQMKTLPVHLLIGIGEKLEILEVTQEAAYGKRFPEALESMTSLRTLIINCSKEQDSNQRQQPSLLRLAKACPSLDIIYSRLSYVSDPNVMLYGPQNERWKIQRDSEDRSDVVGIELDGMEYGNLFHQMVETMFGHL